MARNDSRFCKAPIRTLKYLPKLTLALARQSIPRRPVLLSTNFLGTNYPHSPPRINFITRIYHPNISCLGRIALDILGEKWSSGLTVEKGISLMTCSWMSFRSRANLWEPSSSTLDLLSSDQSERSRATCSRYCPCLQHGQGSG